MFEVTLRRVQEASIWRSEGAESNENAAQLQQLFDENIEGGQAYARELQKLKDEGHQFRLTEGKVFQLFPSDDKIKVPIKLQVKEGVITWYFVAPHDVTHQEFRDEVYRSAALAHLRVQNACEKYLRGTNSFHVKKMHTSEEESGLNHNHYRLMEGHDVTPIDLRQHLMGFIEAQRKLAFVSTEGDQSEKFLDEKEAAEILKEFEIHWAKMTHKGEARTVEVAGEKLELPAREKSLLEEYKEGQLTQWSAKDWKEWKKYQHLEQPCRTIDTSLPLQQQIDAAEKGMRGIRSEAAHRRQMPASRFKVLKTKYKTDDDVAKLNLPPADQGDIKTS